MNEEAGKALYQSYAQYDDRGQDAWEGLNLLTRRMWCDLAGAALTIQEHEDRITALEKALSTFVDLKSLRP